MNALVLIPARGGSKGVPGKNIKPLNGKPLILYTLDAARGVFPDENICVSTDDEAIKNVVTEAGLPVPFLRPDSLATDIAGSREVCLHAIEYYEKQEKVFDTLILLQPTSPFRTATHIREAMALYSDDIDMVVGVTETKSNPYYVLFEENDQGFLEKSKQGNFTRRQDCPKVWEYNGSIYIINISALKQQPLGSFTRIRKYEMEERVAVDIDTPLDWLLCEVLIEKGL